MISNDYYSLLEHGNCELIDIGTLALEDGGSIPRCQLAVATHGVLNEEKNNAILIPTWYSGTSKIISDVYVGETRALNPDKYFIIIVNQIGGGLSSSPHNAQAPANFPHVRISDDVRAQHKLLTEHFKLNTLELVVGGSMGAQQTFEWAVRYPEMVKRAAAIAGTARNTDHDFIFTETLCEALTSDPAWNNGDYEASGAVAAGLKRHAKIWAVMGWSTEFYSQNRPAQLGFQSLSDFIENFMIPYFAPMDVNNLLCMAWKWQRGDVSRLCAGDLAEALDRITAKTYVMPIDHDMFFPPSDCAREQRLIPNSELRVLKSVDGHLALFGADSGFLRQVDDNLRELLAT